MRNKRQGFTTGGVRINIEYELWVCTMTSTSIISKVFALNLVFLEVFHIIAAHSFLTKPMPYDQRTKETADCRGHNCINACPELTLDSRISEKSPSETWRRGQIVTITWARNNHNGGFAGFSLVPIAHRHNSSVHELLTISHACWETGMHRCTPREDCGTDRSKKAYGTTIKVPQVFPDGLYVFRYVWYGGLHYKRKRGFFPDFKSCTFVRVRGGRFSNHAYTPRFAPGRGQRIHNGRCETSSKAIGECPNLGCFKNKMKADIPKRFKVRKLNQAFTKQDILSLMREPDINGQESKEDNNSLITADRICKDGVCCPIQCGRCGGIDCQLLPGGSQNCCMTTIRKARRPCWSSAPPCVRSGQYWRRKNMLWKMVLVPILSLMHWWLTRDRLCWHETGHLVRSLRACRHTPRSIVMQPKRPDRSSSAALERFQWSACRLLVCESLKTSQGTSRCLGR